MRGIERVQGPGCSLCLVVLLLGLVGCVDSRPAQRMWGYHMIWAGAVVERAAGWPEARFTPQQLRVMVGKPDYVLSVEQFVHGMTSEMYDRDLIMTRLRKGFVRCTTAPLWDTVEHSPLDKPDSERTLEECELWVYEENQRFTSPLPAWGWDPGYSCYVFLVQDRVLGMVPFIRWQPLEV